MKLELINHGRTKLLIFFCGFYTDASCFAEFDNCAFDILFAWDYSELDYSVFDEIDFTPYTEVNLVAYSYGVWAGAGVARDYLPYIEKSVAVAGTLLPVHDEFGVPEKIFTLMLNSLSQDTLENFERKMFQGTPATSIRAEQELQNLEDELLNVLKNRDLHGLNAGISSYDHVIITKNDKIFPCRSQRAFWQNHRNKTELECGHFPFYEFKNFEEMLDL